MKIHANVYGEHKMKFLKLLEKFLPLIFWVFLIFAFDTPRFAILTLAAALIHEIGHITFGASRGILRLIPSPKTSGFRITPPENISYKDELILLIGGPVLNLSFFFFSFALRFIFQTKIIFDFAIINLLTALSNLLPIKSYDGYRIIESLILMKKSESNGYLTTLSLLSFAFTVILTFLSLYLILKIGEGYWIFALFFSSAVLEIKKLAENNVF